MGCQERSAPAGRDLLVGSKGGVNPALWSDKRISG